MTQKTYCASEKAGKRSEARAQDREMARKIHAVTLFRLGGGGAFDATQDLNPLLFTSDCV